MVAISVNAVAEAAGVTKGGLFHHFPNKQALVNAVLEQLLEMFNNEIDAMISADGLSVGSFTRAYVTAVTKSGSATMSYLALWRSMMTDTTIAAVWRDWYTERLVRHQDTDRGQNLELVRYAADGIWLGLVSGVLDAHGADVLSDRLLTMSRST